GVRPGVPPGCRGRPRADRRARAYHPGQTPEPGRRQPGRIVGRRAQNTKAVFLDDSARLRPGEHELVELSTRTPELLVSLRDPARAEPSRPVHVRHGENEGAAGPQDAMRLTQD